MDKGRFLLVELNADLVESCQKGDEPCYGIRPLEENMVVFQESSKTTARWTPQVQIQNLLERSLSFNSRSQSDKACILANSLFH